MRAIEENIIEKLQSKIPARKISTHILDKKDDCAFETKDQKGILFIAHGIRFKNQDIFVYSSNKLEQ